MLSRRSRRILIAHLLWYWTKPLALVHLITQLPVTFFINGKLTIWDGVGWLVEIFIWYFYRNMGDDNDHKKLKNKLKEKITRIGSKLVVVPESAG